MKEQDYLDQNLRELFKSTELLLHMPADRKTEVLNQLLQETDMSTEYVRIRIPWIKLAVTAMVLLAILLGICLMDEAGVAFADILENIQQKGYTFTYWSRQKDGELKEMGRGMVLQPGLIRWDMPDDQWKGLALVVDAINHQTRWVTTAGKDLGEVQMPEEVQEDPNRYQSEQNFMLGPVEELWGLVDGTEESLGSTTRDGIDLVGYRVEKPLKFQDQQGMFIYTIYTIWADASTAMPHEVTIETRDPTGKDDGLQLVLTNFDFTADIDESLFGMGPSQESEDVNENLFTIQPGVGMGELLFGTDQAKVTEILGEPDFMGGDGLYQYTGLAVVTREGKVNSFWCGDAKGPGTRHTEQCPCRTTEGIGVGSSEQDIVEAYGEPTGRTTTRQGDDRIGYRSKGMGFILRNDKVYFMSFSIPRQNRENTSQEKTDQETGTDKAVVEEEEKTTAQEPEDVNENLFTIQPGVGMGMLCFGDDSSKIEEFVGIPESAQGGVFYVYPGFTVIAQGGKVYKIICGDDKGSDGGYKCPCRTLKGIAIGSTEQAVIQAYGQPDTKLHDSSQYSGATQWLYREKGMTIAIVNNRVYLMSFKKPINKLR
jgi:outer membrane lipoprotein-sorting protein